MVSSLLTTTKYNPKPGQIAGGTCRCNRLYKNIKWWWWNHISHCSPGSTYLILDWQRKWVAWKSVQHGRGAIMIHLIERFLIYGLARNRQGWWMIPSPHSWMVDDTIATFMNQLPTFPAYWRGVWNFVFEFVPTISCKICKTVTLFSIIWLLQ